MTVSKYTPLSVTPGAGAVLAPIAIPSPFYNDSDIKVYFVDSRPDAINTETLLVKDTNYTMTKAAIAGTKPRSYTGTISVIAAVPASCSIAVMIDPLNVQASDLSAVPFSPMDYEREFDLSVMRDAALRELVKRSVRSSLSSSTSLGAVFPAPESMLVIGWNEFGNLQNFNVQQLVNLAGAATVEQGLLAETAVQGALNKTLAAAMPIYSGRQFSIDGRIYAWKTGNFSALVTADTSKAIYFAHQTIPSTVGAFVLQGDWISNFSFSLFPLAGDGVTDDGAVLLSVMSLASLLGVTDIEAVRGKIYLTGNTVVIPLNTRLRGGKTAKIKQKASTNLYSVVAMLSGSTLFEISVDANEAGGNTTTVAGVHIANNNDCTVERSTIENVSGHPVLINAGARARVLSCKIRNFKENAITVYGVGGDMGHLFDDNKISEIGWAAVVVQQADGARVTRNKATGQIIGHRYARMNVNVNGDQVTWVSGPKFDGIRGGNFLVYDGGREIRIKSVQSNVAITLEVAAPAPMANTQATMGSGDLYAMVGSRYFVVDDNLSERTATFGMGASLSTVDVICGYGRFSNNRIYLAGKNGLNLGAGGGLLGSIQAVRVIDNDFQDVGCGGGIGAEDRIAIYVSANSLADPKISDILVDGNKISSFAGDGQTTYYFGTDGQLNYGSVVIGRTNKAVGVANGSLILRDVIEILLSAGWGTTAVADTIESNGHSVRFLVRSLGTGQLGSPTVTVKKICDCGDAPVMINAQITSGSQYQFMIGEQFSTPGQWIAYFNGTPVAAQAFQIQMKG